MVISFTKVKLPNGWFGNMSPHPIVYNGQEWRTAEALFQSLRFSDSNIKEKIRAEKSPMGAKMVAKANEDRMTVVPISEEDIKNMEMVCQLKIDQHPELRHLLKETGDQLIVEDITKRASGGRHSFWGAAWNGSEWIGNNALGKIWMKIRNEVK